MPLIKNDADLVNAIYNIIRNFVRNVYYFIYQSNFILTQHNCYKLLSLHIFYKYSQRTDSTIHPHHNRREFVRVSETRLCMHSLKISTSYELSIGPCDVHFHHRDRDKFVNYLRQPGETDVQLMTSVVGVIHVHVGNT